MKILAPHLDRARHDNCSYNRGYLGARICTLVALLLAWVLTALPATAAPTFSVSEVNPAGGYHNYGIATGDFNRDGRPDLVMVSAVYQQIFVFLNHGGGNFDPAVSFPSDNPDRQLEAVAVADMNGDGNLDVVAIDEILEEAVVFLGRGDGTFTVGPGFPCGSANNRYLVIAEGITKFLKMGWSVPLLAASTNRIIQTTTPEKVGALEASKYYNETLTVTGKVAQVTVRPKVTFINLDQSGPSSPFTAVIFQENMGQFGDVQRLQGKNIEIKGMITDYHNKPEIILESTNQVKVLISP